MSDPLTAAVPTEETLYAMPFATIERPERIIRSTLPLLVFPVSMGNARQENGKALAAIRAINDSLRDPETKVLNLVIHVTDRIHQFGLMAQNSSLSLDDARKLADEEGRQWVNRNLFGITTTLGYQPIIFHWRQWEDKHSNEYKSVLAELKDLFDPGNPKFVKSFHNAVIKDIEDFHVRTNARLGLGDRPLDDRTRELYVEYVLNECAGYVLMGRHLRADYMEGLAQANSFRIIRKINDKGGLPENIYRLYPGGHLNAIKALQNGGTANFPRGAEKIISIKINLELTPTSNSNAGLPIEDVRADARPRARGAAINGNDGTSDAAGTGVARKHYRAPTSPLFAGHRFGASSPHASRPGGRMTGPFQFNM